MGGILAHLGHRGRCWRALTIFSWLLCNRLYVCLLRRSEEHTSELQSRGPPSLHDALPIFLLTPVFRALGSFEPVWADAWTFVGSLLATFGMAKGWVEFWLIWVIVDVVGVPLLFSAGYYATAFMYVFYGGFTLIGFFIWARARAKEKPAVETLRLDPTLQDTPPDEKN